MSIQKKDITEQQQARQAMQQAGETQWQAQQAAQNQQQMQQAMQQQAQQAAEAQNQQQAQQSMQQAAQTQQAMQQAAEAQLQNQQTAENQKQAQQAMQQAAQAQQQAQQAAVAQPEKPILTPEQQAAEERRKMFGVEMPAETKVPEINDKYWEKYGNYNWNSNGGDFFKNVAEADIPLADAIRYYDAFQKDNGGQPLDPYSLYALMGKYDPTQSVKKQNEEDERLKRQQQWEKIGNVLSHMANLYGTMKGAPAMPLEDAPALTKRQQEQVDRVRTLRQAAGKQYLDALQAKKAEEFKQKQMEHQDRMYDLQNKKLELEEKYKNAKTEAEKEKLQAQMAELQAKLALLAARTEKTQTETKAIPKKLENDTKRANATQMNANTTRTRVNKTGSGGGGRGGSNKVVIKKTDRDRYKNGEETTITLTGAEANAYRKKLQAEEKAQKAEDAMTAEQKEALAKKREEKKNSQGQAIANKWKKK